MTLAVGRFSGRAEEWDELVLRSPGWTHFHLHGWRGVIERVFGHECIYLAARDNGDGLAGVLPLVRVKSLLFGHYLVSMPFLNYGGPLGSEEAVRALCDHAAPFVAALAMNNLFAVQFHPEKSGDAGARVLANFIAQAAAGS